MRLEDWKKQFEWNLRRRAVLTIKDAGIEESELQSWFSRGKAPLEAVLDFIENRGLDDCFADPWTGPSSEYWKNWERSNPFPHCDPAGL